jgi:hypothetical protein
MSISLLISVLIISFIEFSHSCPCVGSRRSSKAWEGFSGQKGHEEDVLPDDDDEEEDSEVVVHKRQGGKRKQ